MSVVVRYFIVAALFLPVAAMAEPTQSYLCVDTKSNEYFTNAQLMGAVAIPTLDGYIFYWYNQEYGDTVYHVLNGHPATGGWEGDHAWAACGITEVDCIVNTLDVWTCVNS